MQRKAILFQVKTNQEKISHLTSLAKKQFDLGHKLLIRTQNEKASQSIDRILWSQPIHSFLPHKVSLDPSYEIICITHIPVNVNGATTCLNLTPDAIVTDLFTTVYDFDDATTPEKQQLSLLKIKAYKEALFSIASF